jgi:RNA ligase (TIGR02306 family)
MKKSTHRVEVVELNPFKHPNADALSIQKVYGYQVVLRTEDWKGITLGAYLVPDSVVDTDRSEFAWLKPPIKAADGTITPGNPNFRAAIEGSTQYHRVTVMRLRGVISYGLMVPAPAGARAGDDVADILGVTRYQPTEMPYGSTEPPSGYHADYDVEAFERWAGDIFKPGEPVVAYEKLDGVNSRYCWADDRLHAGSHTMWLEHQVDSPWWRVPTKIPAIVELCKRHPELTLYGEIIGAAGHKTSLKYGLKPGEFDFYTFDILKGTEFMNADDMEQLCQRFDLKVVPKVGVFDYDFETLTEVAEGKTLVPGANHKREGIVVRPLVERIDLVGRAVLKIVASYG